MFRYRLRTFLIVITLFCLLLGWRVSAVESVERPIRELERLGWHIDFHSDGGDTDNPPPRNYWQKLAFGYRECDLPDFAWLGELSGIGSGEQLESTLQQSVVPLNRLPSLDWLDVSGIKFTDDCLQSLERCQYVRMLGLSATKLDDSAVDELAKFTRLDTLFLWETRISSEAARQLATSLPNCQIEHNYNDD